MSAVKAAEFMLCFLTAASISVNVFAGYEMTDPWHNNLLMVGAVTFAMMMLLFLTDANLIKRQVPLSNGGKWISFSVTALLLVGEVAALQLTGAFSGPAYIDGNPVLFWVITVTVSIAVYWTARTGTGMAILFLVFTYMCVAFDFLIYPVSLKSYGVALLCITTLYACRGQRGENPSNLIRGAAVALIAVLLASGTYLFIIKPLVEPEKDIRLAERLMTMEILRTAGISSETVIVQEPALLPEEPEAENEEMTGGTAGEKGSLIQIMAITYGKNVVLFWFIAASPLLLLALAVTIKLFLRRKWYRRQLRKSNEEGVAALYLRLIRSLKRAGVKRVERQTLLDFAKASCEKLENFTSFDTDFLYLTEIYVKMIYGYQKVSEEEQECFEDFYKPFYKNLRRQMGTLRYCFYFFVL